MATKKVTQLTTATSAADLDLVMIVDVADPAMSPEGTNKQITKANLFTGVGGGILTQTSNIVSNADVLDMKYDDTPITLVAATVGKIHIPVSVTIVAVGAGSAESSNDTLLLGWDAVTGTSADYILGIKRFMDGISSGTTSGVMTPTQGSWVTAYPASPVNKPLQLWCSDVFNGGWSMTVYTTYYSITV